MTKTFSFIFSSLYFKLTWMFVKIGFLSFGGGYAMMSIIFNVAEKAVGMTTSEFSELIAIDFMIPGPLAINAATYVGYITGFKTGSIVTGILGAAFATIGVAIPSFVIVLTVMFFMEKFKENKILQKFLSGIRPASVGLIAVAAIMLTPDTLFKKGVALLDFIAAPLNFIFPISIAIFIAAAVAIIKFKVNPILVTVLSGVAGAILYAL